MTNINHPFFLTLLKLQKDTFTPLEIIFDEVFHLNYFTLLKLKE